MAITQTPRLLLQKQDAGDLNWDAGLNDGLDNADLRIVKISSDHANEINPNLTVDGDYVGQRYYDEVRLNWWVCTIIGSPGTWEQENDYRFIDPIDTIAEEYSKNIRDPGDSSGPNVPVDLEEEIQSLRHRIKALEVGLTAKRLNGTPLFDEGSWFDGPTRFENIAPNPRFLQFDSGNSVPYGYSQVGVPTAVSLQDSSSSEGREAKEVRVQHTAGATDEGLGIVLDSLKDTTRYLVVARVRPDVGEVHLKATGTVGGFFGDLDLASAAASGTYETLAGIFETDVGDITLNLVSADANADFSIASLGLYEIGDDFAAPEQRAVADSDTGTDDATYGVLTYVKRAPAGADMEVSVYIPGPGWVILAWATVGGLGGPPSNHVAQIEQDDGTIQTVIGTGAHGTSGGTGAPLAGIACSGINLAPVAGLTYTYKILATGPLTGSLGGKNSHWLNVLAVRL